MNEMNIYYIRFSSSLITQTLAAVSDSDAVDYLRCFDIVLIIIISVIK